MTEPDPLARDYSKIEQGLSDLYRPVAIDPEFSSRSEKKLVEQHHLKARSFRWHFTALRGHATSFGWVLFFAAFLVIMVLVIETFASPSSVHPANQPSGGAITPTPTIISTLTPKDLPVVLPTNGMLPAPSSNNQRIVSADGRWTAVFNSETGGLEIESSTGVTQMLLAKEITVYGASWSPDSAMLAISASRKGTDPAQTTVAEIWLSQVDGDTIGEMKPVYLPEKSSGVDLSGGLQIDLGAWSPDSSRILFWQGMMSASAAMDGLPLWILDARTGGVKHIANSTLLNPGYQSWAPDSRALVFSNGGYRSAQVMKWLSLYQVDSGQATDLIPMNQLVPGLVSWAPDGKQIALAAVDATKTGMDLADYSGWDNPAILARRIYLLDIKTEAYRRLDQTEAYQDAPRWAGKDLLFVQMGQNQVTLMDANLENGVTTPLPGCQAALPAAAGIYGQTNWQELYDSCKSVGQTLGGNTVSQSQTAAPAATTVPGVVKPEVLAAIRIFSSQDPVNVVYRGKTPVDPSMPGVVRDMYSVDGAEFGLDPHTNQVVWYMAVPDQTAGNQAYTVDELQLMALKFVNAHTPGVQIHNLSFERGNKLDNYFFRWSTAATGPGYLVYVQVGFKLDESLFQYINILPAVNP